MLYERLGKNGNTITIPVSYEIKVQEDKVFMIVIQAFLNELNVRTNSQKEVYHNWRSMRDGRGMYNGLIINLVTPGQREKLIEAYCLHVQSFSLPRNGIWRENANFESTAKSHRKFITNINAVLMPIFKEEEKEIRKIQAKASAERRKREEAESRNREAKAKEENLAQLKRLAEKFSFELVPVKTGDSKDAK